MVLIPKVGNRVLSILEGFASDGTKAYVGDCPQSPFGAGGSGAGPGSVAPSPPAGLRQEGMLTGFANDGLKVYANTDCGNPGFQFDTILSLLTGFATDGKKVYAAGCCSSGYYGSGGSGSGTAGGIFTPCCPNNAFPQTLYATFSGVTGTPQCTCYNGLVVPLNVQGPGGLSPSWKSGTFPQYMYTACGFNGFLSLTCSFVGGPASFQLSCINNNFGGTISFAPAVCNPVMLTFVNCAVGNPNCGFATITVTQ